MLCLTVAISLRSIDVFYCLVHQLKPCLMRCNNKVIITVIQLTPRVHWNTRSRVLQNAISWCPWQSKLWIESVSQAIFPREKSEATKYIAWIRDPIDKSKHRKCHKKYWMATSWCTSLLCLPYSNPWMQKIKYYNCIGLKKTLSILLLVRKTSKIRW